MQQQLAELTGIVRAVLRNPDLELEESTPFEDLPCWDSMYLVSVVVEAECHFGIVFEPYEMETLITAGQLLRMIAGKRMLLSDRRGARVASRRQSAA